MNLAKELKQYSDTELFDLRQDLIHAGYEVAFGSTYSIQEIRKAIQQQHPVFARVGNGIYSKTVYIVGEDESNLIAYKDDDLYSISDTQLKKSWTGDAIIVTGKERKSLMKADVLEIEETKQEEEIEDFVIFPSERDNWDVDYFEIKNKSKRQIERVKFLECYKLPAHPVLCVYQKPSDTFIKKGIRAANNGVEIQIYDPSDPYTEFLHELGHIYYNTQLTSDEKRVFDVLQSQLSKPDLPPIFLVNWDWATGEEIFATVYYWYVKGNLSHPGYHKIMQSQYSQGYNAIEAVFNRVRDSIAESKITKAQTRHIEKEWKDNERNLSIWINNRNNKPSLALIKGKGLLKSRVPDKPVKIVKLPDSVKHTILGERGNLKWVHIESGLLKGETIVFSDNLLDLEYMGNRNNYQLVPVLRKTVDKVGKTYKRTVYVKPDILLKAMNDQGQGVKEKRQIRQEAVRFIQRIKDGFTRRRREP